MSLRLTGGDPGRGGRTLQAMPSAPGTGEPLLLRVARGDPEAVGACLERYGALVWSIARGLSNDVSQVEDAVQEIFIELWRSADRFDPSRASEATFIATIARRRIIDRRRRIARRPESEILEGHDPPVADAGLAQVDISDEADRASRALATLRPEQRRVIEMSVVEGLTHREIAAATGMPLGTVKSHIRRGLDRVATLVQRGEEEEG